MMPFVDLEMEQMKALLEVIQLGRACRNLASMKVRQPASKILVRGAAFDDVYGELARDELNVKELVFTEDAAAFTGYKLSPSFAPWAPALVRSWAR